MVYENVLQLNQVLRLSSDVKLEHNETPALLRVCRQMRQEAHEMYYASNAFWFDDDDTWV